MSQIDLGPATKDARPLLDLLVAYLNEREPTLTFDERASESIVAFARKQGVSTIVAYLAARNPALFASRRANDALSRDLYRAVAMETLQTKEFELVNETFRAQNVRFLPLKGFLMRSLYQEPYLRLMGDYDALAHPDDFERAAAIVKDLGFQFNDSDECHYSFHKDPGLVLELHFALFEESSPFFRPKPYPWERLVPFRGSEFRFTNEDFYAFAIEHFIKHWITGECSLRSFFDLAVYWKKKSDVLDISRVELELERTNALAFARSLARLRDVLFDDKPTDAATNEAASYLFGLHSLRESSAFSRDARYAVRLAMDVATSRSRFPRLRYFAANVFPKRVSMRIKREVEGKPALVRAWKTLTAWCAFTVKRVFSANFFKNVAALFRAKQDKSKEISAFFSRTGLDEQVWRQASLKEKYDDSSRNEEL